MAISAVVHEEANGEKLAFVRRPRRVVDSQASTEEFASQVCRRIRARRVAVPLAEPLLAFTLVKSQPEKIVGLIIVSPRPTRCHDFVDQSHELLRAWHKLHIGGGFVHVLTILVGPARAIVNIPNENSVSLAMGLHSQQPSQIAFGLRRDNRSKVLVCKVTAADGLYGSRTRMFSVTLVQPGSSFPVSESSARSLADDTPAPLDSRISPGPVFEPHPTNQFGSSPGGTTARQAVLESSLSATK